MSKKQPAQTKIDVMFAPKTQ